MDKKRVLIPVDGSPQSMAAVKYASRIFSRNAQVVLFHIRSRHPETYLDLGADSDAPGHPLEAWRGKSLQKIDLCLEEAVQTFQSQGFEEKGLEIVSERLKQGYARDILQKSKSDFDALVIGRIGFTTVGSGVLGGVAAKLVESAKHLALIVVGGTPTGDKILIALDGSTDSKKALACVAELVSKDCGRLLLATVVRPLNLPHLAPNYFFKQRLESDWLDDNTRKIVPLLAEMRKRLIDQGFKAEGISESILREQTSRADGIVGEARRRNYETIVTGRKGLTSTPDFVMGRVTRKVLHLCNDRAVWIV